MTKELMINGMTCNHCKMRVENALKGVSGVEAVSVDLAAKTATVEMASAVEEALLKEVVEDAGYDVIEIR